jgi:hypothetical protein
MATIEPQRPLVETRHRRKRASGIGPETRPSLPLDTNGEMGQI